MTREFLRPATPEEMALNTGIAQDDFEHMLTLIQSFYPPGVGARDLRECLLIQLRRDGKGSSLEYKIISEHMQDLGKRRFPEIARRMGISVEQVQKCANNIAQLEPRPGAIFAEAPKNYVVPDVTVEKVNGEYQVILNGDQIPHLRISNTYKDIMAQDGNGNEVKDYIRDKIRSGKFLIKSIHQRQQTISNIAHQIVSRQREFFDKGSSQLKPMTMVQIADAVGVHETTVSRAISGKYMATPQGVYEMKYFFTPGYQTATGESMSNTSVKEAILDLVKNEDGNAPLSDKEIVEILSNRGIPIARRTVAKYRTELAAQINSGMPLYVVTRIAEALNDRAKSLRGSRVLVLGVLHMRGRESGIVLDQPRSRSARDRSRCRSRASSGCSPRPT